MPSRPIPHVPPRPRVARRLLRAAALVVAAGGVAFSGVAAGSPAAGAPLSGRAGGVGARVADGFATTIDTMASARASARALAAAQRVTVAAPAAAGTSSVVTIEGTVSPARRGLAVAVQRRYGGRWHTVVSTGLTSKGTWSARVRTPKGRGWLRYRAVVARNGVLPSRAVEARRIDNYTRHTYVVRQRGAVVVSLKDFAAQAAQTYADGRGWRAGHHRFARVGKGGDFTLVLAEARYLPSYSSVCSARYSCRVGRYVIINQNRWRNGSAPFSGTLRDYRHMVVNHETGHWLGRHHETCGGRSQLAPVMQQQSKSLQGCRPNPWPLGSELRAVS